MQEEELIAKIKYLKDVQKLSMRQIAAQLGISRKRLSRMCSPTWKGSQNPRGSYLDPYRSLIIQWLSECPSLKAIQIFQRLKSRSINLSYPMLVQYTRALRKKKTKAYWPLEFLPSEEAQVDWFFINHPILGKLAGFAMILSYSRYLFVHLFMRHSFEFFIQGHLFAFQAFKGLTRALRYDNLKSVVLKKVPLTYNSAFLDFARYYGFEIRLCNLASGNEKGRVERVIRHLRDTFFNTADHYTTLQALNLGLHEWVDQRNNTAHRVTGKPPRDMRVQESLKPLPEKPWLNILVLTPKQVSKIGMVSFDTCLYSLPDYLCGQWVSLHVTTNLIEIFDAKQNKVATHPRSFQKNKSFLNPLHRSLKHISVQAKRDRVFSSIRNLDPIVKNFLALNQSIGEEPIETAYLIFKSLASYSREMILSAFREALGLKQYRWKFVESILQGAQDIPQEGVSPQNQTLLSIHYEPRTLEVYQNDKSS